MTADDHEFSGAYAVDALEPREREAYRRHLADCPDCTCEVPRLQEAAAWLALAAARHPPPCLKERVLDEVARTPQLLPELPGCPTRAPERGTRRPWLLRLALAVGLVATATLSGRSVWQATALRARRTASPAEPRPRRTPRPATSRPHRTPRPATAPEGTRKHRGRPNSRAPTGAPWSGPAPAHAASHARRRPGRGNRRAHPQKRS